MDKLRPVLDQIDAVEASVRQLETLAVQVHTQSTELQSAFADLLG